MDWDSFVVGGFGGVAVGFILALLLCVALSDGTTKKGLTLACDQTCDQVWAWHDDRGCVCLEEK